MTTFVDGFEEPSLDALDEGVRVAAVDFSASWCSPCRRQDPLFERVAEGFLEDRPDAPVAFLVVDVDANTELSSRRRVKSVPTTLVLRRESGLVFGEGWREKARFQGVTPYPILVEAIEEQLDD